MADTLYQANGGRDWSIDKDGPESVSKRYFIVLDGNNLAANGEFASFTGLPTIGSTHPTFTRLTVLGYDFTEKRDKDKRVVEVTVKYGRKNESDATTGGETSVDYACREWGWDASTEDREMVTAADGTKVLNSAGDPYESVPRYSAPAPVFTKVMRFASRQSGAMSYNCKTNDAAITIGDMACAKNSLLCTVAEKRLFDDPKWNYEYTVQLKYKTNPVVLAGSGGTTTTDIGWDVAVTDAGMRELDANNKLVLIRVVDEETQKPCVVSSPELLDGSGHKVSRTGGAQPNPYNTQYKAYVETTFPTWFYSEPALPTTANAASDGDDE